MSRNTYWKEFISIDSPELETFQFEEFFNFFYVQNDKQLEKCVETFDLFVEKYNSFIEKNKRENNNLFKILRSNNIKLMRLIYIIYCISTSSIQLANRCKKIGSF